MIFEAKLKNGKFEFSDPDSFSHYKSNPINTGRKIIIIENFSGKRTISQNKLERLWLKILSEYIGCTPEYLHAKVKIEVYGIDENEKIEIDGKNFYSIPQSRKRTKTEFMALLKRLEEIAIELEINLPYPENKNEI
ncbi:MAG: hypothetical protein L6Q54_11565 [Leptospiraceae bacterium]|nr:hypothetical protein [Leptospiraceae bacterium]